MRHLAGFLIVACACGGPAKQFALTVRMMGDGTGTISAPGLTCSGSECTGRFESGTSVELSAVPDASSLFASWDAPCAGSGACSVKVSADTTVHATFLLKQRPVSVNVRLDGGAQGSVSSDPPGISCSSGSCSGSFDTGTTVHLTASVQSGRFVHWTGKCAGSAATCDLSVSGAGLSATAIFLGANYVFTTSTTLDPNNLPLAKADLECNTRAAAAGLP